jgi:Hydantoinase/oxoprolinase N-terminal region
MAWRIGIDFGGTFTDVCRFNDETGAVAAWMVSSMPAGQSCGIADGGVAPVGASAESGPYFGCGTTLAANSLDQDKGTRAGLLPQFSFCQGVGQNRLYHSGNDYCWHTRPRSIQAQMSGHNKNCSVR